MIARVTHAQLDSGEGAVAVHLREIDDAFAPVITAMAPGKVAIASQRSANEPEYGSANRVFVRFVDFRERRGRGIRR